MHKLQQFAIAALTVGSLATLGAGSAHADDRGVPAFPVYGVGTMAGQTPQAMPEAALPTQAMAEAALQTQAMPQPALQTQAMPQPALQTQAMPQPAL
ncbi:hypothetical protein, partial [Streptomyces sp. NPDC002205]|uniref:hypothetical protein n=1 Tax=Streptomyces sp. NPDC002205 TaxID=3154411 RepID=UPI0033297E01